MDESRAPDDRNPKLVGLQSWLVDHHAPCWMLPAHFTVALANQQRNTAPSAQTSKVVSKDAGVLLPNPVCRTVVRRRVEDVCFQPPTDPLLHERCTQRPDHPSLSRWHWTPDSPISWTAHSLGANRSMIATVCWDWASTSGLDIKNNWTETHVTRYHLTLCS